LEQGKNISIYLGGFYFYVLGGTQEYKNIYEIAPTLPIMNWIVDHPLYYYPLENAPPTHLPIVHDPTCADFIGRYCVDRPPYGAICLPHAGYPSPSLEQDRYLPPSKREIDVLFSGSLETPESILKTINGFANKTLSESLNTAIQFAMKRKIYPLDNFIMNTLTEDNKKPDINALRLFFKYLDKYHRSYYRWETLKALVKSGMELNVYTDQPAAFSSLAGRKSRVRIHPQVSFQKFTQLASRTKIILNPSYTNGDGLLSERIPTAMVNGAVSISSRGRYAATQFKENEEILFYDTPQIPELPYMIQKLLQDPERLDAIALAGQKKAKAAHLPIHRAQTILPLVREFTEKFILGNAH
jgi:hypothetical protein